VTTGGAADDGRGFPLAGDDLEARPVEEQLALAGGDGRFTGVAVGRVRHTFGGMLVAQALRAAQVTGVPAGRRPNSVHGSFIGSPDGRLPLEYEVERTRDGRSFSTRRVVVRQSGATVFVLNASFHDDEPGLAYELPPEPGVPDPEDLPVGRYATPFFDSRDVPVASAPSRPPLARRAWFRSRLPMPDDQLLHDQALAYLSDHGPTRAVREPFADHPGVEQRMSVSLDHSVWFHRPARVDEWLLSELVPVWTGAGRGLALGTIRTASGALVATVTQETLLRVPEG
jgi:acyl-CoA thioesterase-2